MNPSPDLDLLLREGPWLRRLARAIAGDDGDDLCQDVLAAALTGDVPHERAPLRTWLRTAARRLGRRSADRARWRGDAEAAAAQRTRTTVDAADRIAAQEAIARALSRVDEPCRSAVVLRYFDDLPSREIAERLGISPAAARKRVSRGVARLRDELEGEHGPGAELWSFLLLPLAPPERSAAPAASAVLSGSTVIMSTKWSVAAAAAALTLCLATLAVHPWRSGERQTGDSGERSTRLAAPTAEGEPAMAPLMDDSSVRAPTVDAGAPRATATAPGVLRGRVLLPDGAPAGSAAYAMLLEVGADGVPSTEGEGCRVGCDREGAFELEVPEWAFTRPVLLVGRDGTHVPATMPVALFGGVPDGEMTLRLGAGEALRGRVARDGQPVPGVRVSLDARWLTPGIEAGAPQSFWTGGALVEKWTSATSDVDGRFAFPHVVRGRYDLIVGAGANAVPSNVVQPIVFDGSDVVVDLTCALLRVRVWGSVFPLDGVRLRVTSSGEGRDFDVEDGEIVLHLAADADVTLAAHHPRHASLEVDARTGPLGSLVDVDLTLDPVRPVTLSANLPGAFASGVARIELDLLRDADGAEVRRVTLERTDREDTFAVHDLGLEEGDYQVRLESVGTFRSEVVAATVASGDVVEALFEGAHGGRYQVDVTSALTEWRATWYIEDATGRRWSAQRDVVHRGDPSTWLVEEFAVGHSAGHASLQPDRDVIPAGKYFVVVESGSHWPVRRAFQIDEGALTRVEVELQAR